MLYSYNKYTNELFYVYNNFKEFCSLKYFFMNNYSTSFLPLRQHNMSDELVLPFQFLNITIPNFIFILMCIFIIL